MGRLQWIEWQQSAEPASAVRHPAAPAMTDNTARDAADTAGREHAGSREYT
jgi:hypothetical protein